MPELTHPGGGVQPPGTDDTARRARASADNRRQVETMLNHRALPAPTLIGRPDAAYVTVTDPDDLLPWLEQLGGRVHVSPVWEGVVVWILRTTTDALPDGSCAQVRVFAVAHVDEPVMAELAEAAEAVAA